MTDDPNEVSVARPSKKQVDFIYGLTDHINKEVFKFCAAPQYANLNGYGLVYNAMYDAVLCYASLILKKHPELAPAFTSIKKEREEIYGWKDAEFTRKVVGPMGVVK